MTNKSASIDCIHFLMNDHVEIKKYFYLFSILNTDAYTSKKKLAEKICTAVAHHIKIEEEFFYPMLRKAGEAMEERMDEAMSEHANAKELIAEIEAQSNEDAPFDDIINALSQQVNIHFEAEEEDLFPELQRINLDLVSLGKKMVVRKEELRHAV